MERILWVDVMKGLGILSVIIGHIYGVEVSRNMYIFHMPLFFFISGYLLTPTEDYKNYFTKKTVHLLIPYFSFLIPLYICFTEFPSWNIEGIATYFAKALIGGRFLGGYLGVFWFITCLFLTQQIMNYLITKTSSKTLLIVMISMLIFSYFNTYFFPQLWLPWNANVILASAPIFYIGYIYKKRAFRMNNILLLTLGITVILLSFVYPENVYDMKYAKYGIPIITLISSIILILNIEFVSIKLSKYKFSYLILSEIGKASMVIMYLHQPIQMLTNSFISTNNTIRFLMAIIISYLIYLTLSKSRVGKALFLGSYKDLKLIFAPSFPK